MDKTTREEKVRGDTNLGNFGSTYQLNKHYSFG